MHCADTVVAGNNGAFRGHLTASHVPPYAEDNIWRAKEWIETCLVGHKGCQDFHRDTVTDPLQRPTRVLEITESNIRLRCDMANESFEYLVLSHMWGPDTDHQLRLLESNLSKLKLNIPRAAIETSSTFKRAIKVTQQVGYRYLWIDSLCIIQDSGPDWTHEAQRMAIVYGNAACNLAILFPPTASQNADATPTPRGDPRIWSPCILRPATPSSPGVYIEHTKAIWRQEFNYEEKSRPWLVQRNWPLFQRAWTFQEYLLSPRTLLLGAQNLMWQCSEHFYDELLGPIAENYIASNVDPKSGKDRGKSRYFPDSVRMVKTATSLSASEVLTFMGDWLNLINEYRGRRLTETEDRIIAFAGVARAFGNFGGLTYLAGVWGEILPISLLWFVDKKQDPLVRRECGLSGGILSDDVWTNEVAEPVAAPNVPSWSWFAVPVYRFFQTSFLFNDDELYVRSKSYRDPPLVIFDDIFWATATQTPNSSGHSNDYIPSLINFTGLHLTLDTLVLPIRHNLPALLFTALNGIRTSSPSSHDRDAEHDPIFTYYPDIPLSRPSPPKNAVYALICELQVVRIAGLKNIQRRLAGLMLVPSKRQGMWRRVGIWKLRINVVGVDVTRDNMAQVAERWRGFNVVGEDEGWRRGVLVLE